MSFFERLVDVVMDRPVLKAFTLGCASVAIVLGAILIPLVLGSL